MRIAHNPSKDLPSRHVLIRETEQTENGWEEAAEQKPRRTLFDVLAHFGLTRGNGNDAPAGRDELYHFSMTRKGRYRPWKSLI